jgi:hypothetical protein
MKCLFLSKNFHAETELPEIDTYLEEEEARCNILG